MSDYIDKYKEIQQASIKAIEQRTIQNLKELGLMNEQPDLTINVRQGEPGIIDKQKVHNFQNDYAEYDRISTKIRCRQTITKEEKEFYDHFLSRHRNISKPDMVNHPPHYTSAGEAYETIKVIEAWQLDFHLGNTVKYISRWDKKGDPLENLEKAKWYLERKIKQLKEKAE